MRKVIRCTDVFVHICENLDEKLTSKRCRAIRRHLKDCPNCRAYLASLKTTIRLYKSFTNPAFPEEIRKNLFSNLKPNPKLARIRTQS